MKPSIADQLSGIQLQKGNYGDLPTNNDIYLAARHITPEEQGIELYEQWKKLNYIRKNLHIVDRYIHDNKGESLKDWLKKTNQGLSHNVLNAIGDFNDDTKGISVYFLNLERMYDKEEELYDKLESNPQIPQDFSKNLSAMAEERKDKRKNRNKVRNLKFKDIKKNKQGDFIIEAEPDKKKVEVTIEKAEPKKEAEKEIEKVEERAQMEYAAADGQPTKEEKPKIKKSNIAIWIAGAIILAGVITVFTVKDKK